MDFHLNSDWLAAAHTGAGTDVQEMPAGAAMTYGWRLRLVDDGSLYGAVRFDGVNFGKQSQGTHRVWYRDRDVLVIKVAGYSRWGDLLHPSVYQHAKFHVLRLEHDRGDGWWDFAKVVGFPVTYGQ